MKYKITVTQEHIDKGDVGSSHSCPVAIACKDAGLIDPCVDKLVISQELSDGAVIGIYTPIKVAEFIENFDAGKEVKPIEFELDYKEE